MCRPWGEELWSGVQAAQDGAGRRPVACGVSLCWAENRPKLQDVGRGRCWGVHRPGLPGEGVGPGGGQLWDGVCSVWAELKACAQACSPHSSSEGGRGEVFVASGGSLVGGSHGLGRDRTQAIWSVLEVAQGE